MPFSEGEGAISSGPMIPIHGASSEHDARAVVDLLESHQILAIVDHDVPGAYVPPTPYTFSVLVPMSMVGAAQKVLQARQSPTNVSAPARSASEPSVTAPPSVAYTMLDDEDDEDDEDFNGPLDVPLPEPTSLNARLSVALAAIAGGAATQRLLEVFWGENMLRGMLATRWDRLFEEPWRLVTAGFVHGGASHFISNALFGLLIGVVLFGTHRVGATAIVWLLSSIVGLGAEAALSQNAWIVGASAGNYGLVGLWAHGQLQRSRVALLPRRERLRTLGVLLLLVPGAMTPFSSTGTKIAIMAHAAGFVAGFALGYPWRRRLLERGFGRIDRWSRVGGVAAIVITVAAWSMALWTYR